MKAKGNYTVLWVEGSGFKFCFCVLFADSCSFQMLVCCQPHGRGNPTERVMGRQPQKALGPAERAVNSPSGQGDRKHLTTLGRRIWEVPTSCVVAVRSGVWGFWGQPGQGRTRQ